MSLCGSIHDAARLLPLLTPYPAEEMEFYPVSAKVNNPGNGEPECTKPQA